MVANGPRNSDPKPPTFKQKVGGAIVAIVAALALGWYLLLELFGS